MASLSYGDLQSKTYGDLANLTYAFDETNSSSGSASEFKRLVTYQDSVTTGEFGALNGNVRLFIYLDEHMKQHTLSSGWDVHFQTLGGAELDFELVAYQNGVGVWWVATNGYPSFYMLYGDSSRNYDRSTKQVWWGNDTTSSDTLRRESINYGIVLHATYENTSSNSLSLANFTPYTESIDSTVRPQNSAFFDGQPQAKPTKLKVPDEPPTTPPIHLGQLDTDPFVSGQTDDSITYNLYGAMHLYNEYLTPQDGDPYYSPDRMMEPWDIDGSVSLMVAVSAHEGSSTPLPNTSPWYAPVCIASLHELHIIVQGNDYYMWLSDINNGSAIQTTTIGSRMNMNNEEFYYPLLVCLSKKYCNPPGENDYTLYEAWAIQPDTIINLGSCTTSGHHPATITPGITVGHIDVNDPHNLNYPFIQSLKTQPAGTTDCGTDVKIYGAIAGMPNGPCSGYPSSTQAIANSIYLWYMMFQNQSIRTISEPVVDNPTSLFIWNKPRIYQGLAGGCN